MGVTGRARTLVSPSWVGTAWFGPWWLVYRGPVGPTVTHAHHALQAVLGPAVEVQVAADRRSGPLLVPPNTPHRIVAGTGATTLVYVDADVARLRLSAPVDQWARLPAPSTWAAAARLAEAVCPPTASRLQEHDVVRAARLALADPDDRRSVEEIASGLGISASRLSHLFTASVGTPMRSYRRWQRLLVAAEEIAGGSGLTRAAHAAGFADGSHLARTFRTHFGLSIRELTSGVRFATA